ncbi:hypothetical protein EYF80_049555 [Liparis tanakae]|uniref:Uncharacterized protein n=1 Tax=Liparis tanakae TaxID=230148 RepID=A0A4Z2FGG6_9TELE|nr:hypothetical protein EYF80_049555 [Liparis tanakae]
MALQGGEAWRSSARWTEAEWAECNSELSEVRPQPQMSGVPRRLEASRGVASGREAPSGDAAQSERQTRPRDWRSYAGSCDRAACSTTPPLHHSATSLCHAALPRRHVATPLCHAALPRRSATPLCHAALPRRHVATPPCRHAATSPRRSATPLCHAATPL